MTDGPPLHRVREEMAALEPYAPPKGSPEVKLDANESPWPLPEEARDRLAQAVRDLPLHRYPDPRAVALREALADRYGGGADEYVVGAGSDEIIALLTTTFSRPTSGRTRATVLYPTPTFVMYRITALTHGLDTEGVPLDEGWDLDVAGMKEVLSRARPSLLFLATPNNPTGNRFAPERVAELIDEARDTVVVIDEAYGAYANAAPYPEAPHRVTLGTLSKVGLAAVRVGWVRAHPDLARALNTARQPFNLSAPAQAMATLALTELWPLLQEQVEKVIAERTRLFEALSNVPRMRPHPSDANFILVRFAGDARALSRALAKDGIAVKAWADSPLERCLRITVGTPEENTRLLAGLEAAIDAA